MPVVRELVNRISFKISPADKKNALSAMDKMDKRAGDTIKRVGGIGKAISLAIAGLATAGTAAVVDMEKKSSRINFFARNQEEAEALFAIFDKIAASTDQISRRQAQAGASIFAGMPIKLNQVEELSELAGQLALARPELGFEKIAEIMRSVVQGGDLDAFSRIVPGFKDAQEILEKTTFGKTFGEITSRQRGDLLISELVKKQGRIAELARKHQETTLALTQAFKGVGSDFILKFGEDVQPAINEGLKLATELIKDLIESKGLWEAIGATVNGIVTFIKASRDILKPTEEGKETVRKVKEKQIEESAQAVSKFFFGAKEHGRKPIPDVSSAPTAKLDVKVMFENSNKEVVNIHDNSLVNKTIDMYKNIISKNGGAVFP